LRRQHFVVPVRGHARLLKEEANGEKPMPQIATPQRRQTCPLTLTDRERRDLMRLMHRVLAEIEIDKRSYRVLVPTDPNRGRLLKDGEDITLQTNLDEAAARRFLFLARLK
jgi:hypothetical protein